MAVKIAKRIACLVLVLSSASSGALAKSGFSVGGIELGESLPSGLRSTAVEVRLDWLHLWPRAGQEFSVHEVRDDKGVSCLAILTRTKRPRVGGLAINPACHSGIQFGKRVCGGHGTDLKLPESLKVTSRDHSEVFARQVSDSKEELHASLIKGSIVDAAVYLPEFLSSKHP